MKINIGDLINVQINANEKYSAFPSIKVEEGEIYNFTVDKFERWVDFYFIKCSANGFYLPYKKNKLRVPNINYFVLCGVINKDDRSAFIIGLSLENKTIEQSGSLYFFANDHPDYYGNNSGSITCKIKRIK